MAEWTHSMCERCWFWYEFTFNAIPDPDDPESLLMRQPVKLKQPEEETCCFCGEKNRDGIYVREDPAKLDCAHAKDTVCKHCGQLIYLFDYKPTGNEDQDMWSEPAQYWATDRSGDPNEDFICPARESSARWPNGRPHES